MKIKEVREMDAKTLAETKENLQEKLAQMKLNLTVLKTILHTMYAILPSPFMFKSVF